MQAGALGDARFDLICAFDVLEHLEQPEALLTAFAGRLTDDGLIFCSVPNRYALVEIMSWAWWRLGVARGREFAPGEPHIQFKSPQEWRDFIEANSALEVIDHAMAMGVSVVTWSAAIGLPARAVDTVVRRRLGRSSSWEARLTHPRLMAVFDRIDRRLPVRLHALFGSNLFVMRRRAGPR